MQHRQRIIRRGLLAVSVLAVALTVLFAVRHDSEAATATSGVGGQLSIGATTLVSGKVNVPVNTTAATDPWFGFSINLRFDSSMLTFAGWRSLVINCTTLGINNDDPARLRAAADYLERNSHGY